METVEKAKKRKKGFVSEEDISSLLQRYTATTVLALLQEVAQVADVKIDWNALVKKTTTGITSAREYQMLWRHLAYRDVLPEKLGGGPQPLDDDSDLEYELEAFPAVSSEASAEAAACVKVLIASGTPSDPSVPNGSTVEAPLTINIPNGQTSRSSSESLHFPTYMQGTNITIPVSVQKQQLTNISSGETLEPNGATGGNLPPRRKRKPWSAEEDMELIAAVQKCGEGNWANILKGDFKGDRTASQLSQRWAIIRKRKGNLNVGTGSQLTEAQLAARRAMSLALDMPMGDNLKSACSIGTGTTLSIATSNRLPSTAADTSAVGRHAQHQSQEDNASTSSFRPGTSVPSKARVALKKPPTKSTVSPDSMVKAAAVAAGARIATASDAASLLKAAQSKNAVHIMPGGSTLIKSSVTGNANPLPSNVHFIRTGLASATVPGSSGTQQSSSRPCVAQQLQGQSAKSTLPGVQHNSASTARGLNTSSEASNATDSTPNGSLKVRNVEDVMMYGSDNMTEQLVQENQECVPCNGTSGPIERENVALTSSTSIKQVQVDQAVFLGSPKEKVKDQACVSSHTLEEQTQVIQSSAFSRVSIEKVHENQVEVPSLEANLSQTEEANMDCTTNVDTSTNVHPIGRGSEGIGDCKIAEEDNLTILQFDDNQNLPKEICEIQSANQGQEVSSSMVVDGNDEKREVHKAAAGTENGQA